MKSKIILIGASTGGPGHLKKILSALPSSFNASLIVAQHMNSTFIPSFITQFQSELSFKVHSIEHSLELKASHIYFLPSNCVLEGHKTFLHVKPSPSTSAPYNPSVDILFLSALPFTKMSDMLAVLLTGIGNDGALGLSELQKAGAQCIAESEKTAIVYGMPKRAVEINPLIVSKDLDDIIKTICTFGGA